MEQQATEQIILADGAPIDYTGLPENHRDTVRLYLEHGCQPGSGWTAILSNKLDAALKCDDATVAQLPKLLRWLYNRAPADAWGSPEKVAAWIAARRAVRV